MSISRAKKSGISLDSSPGSSRSLTAASGLPGLVSSLVSTATGSTTVSLSWDSPSIAGDSAITGYAISGGGTVTVSGTTATITGLTPDTLYDFTVTPSNSLGSGFGRSFSATTLNFNNATGGTVTTVSNYNGTGVTWRVHTFTSSGTLIVDAGPVPFRVLTAGAGGGAGGPRGDYYYGGGKGGIGVGTINDAHVLTPQSYAVTVGTGGAGGGVGGSGSSGGSSTINSQVSAGGGGGSVGTASIPTPVPNGPSVTTDITGTSITYGSRASANGVSPGSAGANGKVIIAYEIA